MNLSTILGVVGIGLVWFSGYWIGHFHGHFQGWRLCMDETLEKLRELNQVQVPTASEKDFEEWCAAKKGEGAKQP